MLLIGEVGGGGVWLSFKLGAKKLMIDIGVLYVIVIDKKPWGNYEKKFLYINSISLQLILQK